MWIHPKIVKVKSLKSQTILIVLMSHVNSMTLIKFIGCFTFPHWQQLEPSNQQGRHISLMWYAAVCSALVALSLSPTYTLCTIVSYLLQLVPTAVHHTFIHQKQHFGHWSCPFSHPKDSEIYDPSVVGLKCIFTETLLHTSMEIKY